MNRTTFLLPVLIFFPFFGFGQAPDSIVNQKPRFQIRQLIAPTSLIAGGILLNSNAKESIKNEIAEERNDHLPGFHTNVDTYLQFAPIFIMYGFDVAGIKSKTSIGNRTAILVKSEIVMNAVVYFLKDRIHQLRPDGSSYNSLPSGHTAQAFLGAAMLAEEYSYRFKWMPLVAYSMASAVGVMRIMNNKHYISDVLVGAGIGILSTKFIYWTHQYKWGKERKKLPKYY